MAISWKPMGALPEGKRNSEYLLAVPYDPPEEDKRSGVTWNPFRYHVAYWHDGDGFWVYGTTVEGDPLTLPEGAPVA